jgi:hypothetical protein
VRLANPAERSLSPVSLPRNTDPHTMDEHDPGSVIARRQELVESRMRGDTHVRFGGAGRPDPYKADQRAAGSRPSAGRPNPAYGRSQGRDVALSACLAAPTALGPGRCPFLAVTRWDVSSGVRDACANSSRASVRSRLPSMAADPVTTRGNGPTVEDGARSAGTSEISASRRSSRTPSRRASTDALIITGDTPYLPRWLVAELLQLSAVLVQPGRRALRRRQ